MSKRMWTILPILLSLLLIAGACTSDDEDPVDNSGSTVEEETPDEGETPDEDETPDDGEDPVEAALCVPPAEEPAGDEDPHGHDDASLVAPDIIVVPAESIEAVLQMIEADTTGEQPDVITEIDQVIELTEGRYVGNYNPQEGGLLDTVLDFVSLIVINPELVEVREAVESIRSSGIDARPLFLLETQGHYTRSPGVGARIFQGPEAASFAVEAQVSEEIPADVGIIDSGFVARSEEFVDLGGLAPEVDPGDDPCWASHGSFVASVIGKLVPEARLAGRSALPLAGDWDKNFKPEADLPINDKQKTHEISDELAILSAMDQLLADEPGITTLNLSFGTYGTNTDHDIDPEDGNVAEESIIKGCDVEPSPIDSGKIPPGLLDVAIKCAQVLPPVEGDSGEADLMVFAAGGNRNIQQPMYPAAFQNVVGVGATDGLSIVKSSDSSMKLAVWDQDGNVQFEDKAQYPWMDVFFPGCNLVGIATDPTDEVVIWSGSSFATAVATAHHLDATLDSPPDPASSPLLALSGDSYLALEPCSNRDEASS